MFKINLKKRDINPDTPEYYDGKYFKASSSGGANKRMWKLHLNISDSDKYFEIFFNDIKYSIISIDEIMINFKNKNWIILEDDD